MGLFLNFSGLLARFHPLLVHLPIGILLVAAGFSLVARRPDCAGLRPAIPVLYFWGMLGAAASCFSGWLLADGGEYEAALLDRHRWMGIGTAAAAAGLYFAERGSFGYLPLRLRQLGALAALVLLSITGHFGGSLTHGSDYLQEGWIAAAAPKGPVINSLPNPDTVLLYAGVVQPILEARCYGCHGANKQKGKLRLDALSYMLKGGEEGKALVPGQAGESGLLQRIELPLTSKDHMPPKEKAQLSQAEIALLHWWVESGASEKKRIGELEQPASVKKLLAALAEGRVDAAGTAEILPPNPPGGADPAALKALEQAGVTVVPVSREHHWLSVNFIGAFQKDSSTLQLLRPVKDLVIWLQLDDRVLNAAAMDLVASCSNLQKLRLNHCGITDGMLTPLLRLKELRSLSLVGNPVAAPAVAALKALPRLESLYLYQTGVSAADWPALQRALPAVQLDSGGYRLPMLEGDTGRVRY